MKRYRFNGLHWDVGVGLSRSFNMLKDEQSKDVNLEAKVILEKGGVSPGAKFCIKTATGHKLYGHVSIHGEDATFNVTTVIKVFNATPVAA